MSRYGAGSYRLWLGQPVNAALVTPPMSLRVVIILSILSATGTLFFGVANQLSFGGALVTSFPQIIFLVLCYFLLPILIAHTISTNWPISRILISTYLFAVAFQAFVYVDTLRIGLELKALYAAGIFASFVGAMWWLFGSKKLRIYYSLIVGEGLPDDIEGRADDLLAPGRMGRIFGRISNVVGPYSEGAVVIIVLVFMFFALTTYG